MKTSPHRPAVLAALALLALAPPAPAFEKGDTAYAKRTETALLAEPRPLASPAAKVGFAEALKVEEVRGNWLRVKTRKAEGWVFAGNLADKKPSHAPAAGLTTVSASQTDTVAAARPLSPTGDAFAARHDAGKSKEDVEWVDAVAARVPPKAVDDYLRENRKGEYQP